VILLAQALLWLDALAWSAIGVRASRVGQTSPFRVGPEDAPAPEDIVVSVVIPARDEAHNIGPCVAAALAQDHPGVEVVVLDDGSTDGTGEVLASVADPRLRVLQGGGGALPEGWLGKPWACERAGRAAKGAWLLFVDADVRLAPEAVSRALGYALRHQLDALSGFGTLVHGSLGEAVMQPVIGGLLLAGNDLAQVNDPERPEKALANGQFILVSRAAWEAVGGHGAVRANVLDDVGMARALKRAGRPFHLVFMRRLFTCRMYDSLGALWRGWRKNLFAGLHGRWSAVLALAVGHALLTLAPYVGLGAWAIGAVDARMGLPAALGVGAMQALRWHLDGLVGQSRWVGLWSHGLANFALLALVLDSAWSSSRGRATWKGRALPAVRAGHDRRP
jgi:hypothetical protein